MEVVNMRFKLKEFDEKFLIPTLRLSTSGNLELLLNGKEVLYVNPDGLVRIKIKEKEFEYEGDLYIDNNLMKGE